MAGIAGPGDPQTEALLSWLISDMKPPDDFGEWQNCEALFVRALGPKTDASVSVSFVYDSKEFRSLFLPVEVSEQSKIFDEVIELTGVKRTTAGKTLYELDVSIRGGRLRHTVTFYQKIELTNELPLQAICCAAEVVDVSGAQLDIDRIPGY